ncbi:MAG: phosphate acetyltransferase [Deltaproteobacteria bacterium]|nr:MAG: phosphate acetyltransferase [Deltaproteobacteria bacterium]
MPHTVLLAPAGHQVGLTTISLGLVRALDQNGVRVAYAKPISTRGRDHSIKLVELGSSLLPPTPIPRQRVEDLLSDGDDQTLMEEVVALCAAAAEGADVLVVEGMVPESGMIFSSRVNTLIQKALDAELVLVAAPSDQSPEELANAMSIAARGFGDSNDGATHSCVINRIPARGPSGVAPWRTAAIAEKLNPIALIHTEEELRAPRVLDMARWLDARIISAGDMERRRFRDVRLCAMTVPHSIKVFAPGTLIITPADRDDIILAASLAVLDGMKLAGLVLTGGVAPNERVMELCQPAFDTGLPILWVEEGSFQTATRVGTMDRKIPDDDKRRVELTMATIAEHFDRGWLGGLVSNQRARRLSPPAFRHKLIQDARSARRRIVLPEGNEPRTIAAAAIVESRGIAHCVLIGNPDEIRMQAKKQGVNLPESVELIDPVIVAPRYVEPLVEARKSRGMTPDRARSELADGIMIGTMMMHLGEADGLVSGAVHTTAHTIRPALQIIKTAPGADLVSSVFFMCLPDEVLVFGDCAVNPNPTAEQLADIAIQSADTAKAFGIEPRVAMLSYSTGTSGGGEDVEKVKQATDIAKRLRPDLLLDGPLQYDAAIMPDVARTKAPNSPVAGRATVFIFPDLNTGNVTYKAVQRSANVVSMGPVLQGLARPVNDLSRGCLVEDIVFTITITAIQALRAGA